jgi:hypothetical protein
MDDKHTMDVAAVRATRAPIRVASAGWDTTLSAGVEPRRLPPMASTARRQELFCPRAFVGLQVPRICRHLPLMASVTWTQTMGSSADSLSLPSRAQQISSLSPGDSPWGLVDVSVQAEKDI